MREQERAHRLARAIDDLLQGLRPADLEDEDLDELLQIAKIRLGAARSSAHTGVQHEGAVWQQVLARLDRLRGQKTGGPNATNSLENAGESAAIDDPEEFDIKELQDIIGLRRQMAERAACLAEAHRTSVLQQAQARIRARSQRGGLLSFLRRPDPEAEIVASAVDRLVLGEPIWEASDSKLGELMRLAHARMVVGQAATAASRDFQGRLWARIRPRLLARLLGSPQPRSRVFQRAGHLWPKLVPAGAAIALLLAAVGPIPATGLANHPVAQFVRLVGDHVGVSETGAPPGVPPSAHIVEGTDLTTAKAGELLGLPLREPTVIPAGFQQVSSRFFAQPLTASEGGMFVLAYSADVNTETANPPTILIYQEHASGNDIAVQQGFAEDIRLFDGTPATYVEGSWRSSGSQIIWGEDGTQTLVFDRAGLRTIIHYVDGSRMNPGYLRTIAEGMVVVAAP